MQVKDLVEAIAASLDVQRGNLLGRRGNGRLLVAALIGSFAAHIRSVLAIRPRIATVLDIKEVLGNPDDVLQVK